MSECNHEGAGFGYCYRCGAVTDGSDVEEETIDALKAEVTRLRILAKDAYFEGFGSPFSNTSYGSVQSYWENSQTKAALGVPGDQSRRELAEANAKLASALKWLKVMGAGHADAQTELTRILGGEP